MSWFPLFKSQMENKDFRRLSVVQKLFYVTLQGEFNLRKPLFMSDDYLGSKLACSTSAIRQARRKFREYGWVKYRSGCLSKGGKLATSYQQVRWAEVGTEEGQFVQVRRHNWNMILDQIRCQNFCHGDAIVYLALKFWKDTNEYEYADNFFITKRKLSELTGINTPGPHVANLYDKLKFNGGDHLFEFEEEYHRFVLSDWSEAADPEKSDGNAINAERYVQEIQKEVVRRRKDSKRKEKTGSLK